MFADQPILGVLLAGVTLGSIAIAWAFDTSVEVITRISVDQPTWLLPLIVAAGGLVSGLIITLARVDGLTLPRVLDLRSRGDSAHWSVILWVILGTAALLGTGGSGGREGPAAVLGFVWAGVLSSSLRRWRKQSANWSELVGWVELWAMGAFVGVIFNCPIGGALFGVEITVLKGGKWQAFPGGVVASLASAIAYDEITRTPMVFIVYPKTLGDLSPWLLPIAVGLGLLSGAIAWTYSWTLAWVKGRTAVISPHLRRVKMARVGRRVNLAPLLPALGGLAVGGAALAFHLPQILGTGQQWLTPAWVAALPVAVLLLLPLAKMLATCVCVGLGGVAGVFFTAIVIGAYTGAATSVLLHPVLGSAAPPTLLFMAIAMAATLAAAAHTPLTGIRMSMVLVSPFSLGWSGLALMGLAAWLALRVAGNRTLYPAQE